MTTTNIAITPAGHHLNVMEHQQQSCPYFDPNYETLSTRMNPPRVVVDNISCEDATLIKVNSVHTHGALLEVVQVLTDRDLCICKAYITTDGGWFMNVFHVTDRKYKKLTDDCTIEYIKQSLGAQGDYSRSSAHVLATLGKSGPCKTVDHVKSGAEHTIIELTGTDRPGLLSYIFTVLACLGCNVKLAEVWTHNLRVACVVYITEEKSGGAVENFEKLKCIRDQLCNVMKGEDDTRDRATIAIEFSMGLTNRERRLHQMMFADRDYEGRPSALVEKDDSDSDGGKPEISITIQNCKEDLGYSIVNVESRDRPKLLFDTVCTLTDMQYVVFHATINSENGYAHQEYYIRHKNGRCVEHENESFRVIKCLEAAIERRVSDGLRLEFCTNDRVGFLSEVTCMFSENGLSVSRANVVVTRDKQAVNVFYVTDAAGNPVDKRIVQSIQKQMAGNLKVKEIPRFARSPPNERPAKRSKGFSFGRAGKLGIKVLVCLGSLGGVTSL